MWDTGWLAGAPRYCQRNARQDNKAFMCHGLQCLSGGEIQPDVFRRALAGEHQQDGLSARLLVAMLPDREIRWTEQEISGDMWYALERLCDGLLELPGDLEPHGPQPRPMRLGPEAKRLFVEFFKQHQKAKREMDDDLRARRPSSRHTPQDLPFHSLACGAWRLAVTPLPPTRKAWRMVSGWHAGFSERRSGCMVSLLRATRTESGAS
jgi:hypothetical protein